jgi:hypothetical protein
MPKHAVWFACFIAWLIPATSANAQSALERQMSRAMQSQTDSTPSPAGAANAQKTGKTRDTPPQSGWRSLTDGKNEQDGCSITYQRDRISMGYVGPTKDSKDSFFFVSGPEIPPATQKPERVAVVLKAGNDPEQSVQVFHFVLDTGPSAILFRLDGLAKALDVMADAEKLRVSMGGAVVFNGDWTGGHAAREKLRACLVAKGQL